MLSRPQPARTGVRAALHDAREIYRRRSGAEPDGAQPNGAHPHAAAPALPQRTEPDVMLDVSRLHVDEIDLNIQELQARVALRARVLDLVELDVGVDALLRGVGLEIDGVDAQALLKVRLENLTTIVDRVMTTVDRNPQILERLTAGLGTVLDEVGSGAGRAVGELGSGAGSAVGSLGAGAGSAVGELGKSAGSAVGELGKSAGSAVGALGNGAGPVVQGVADVVPAKAPLPKPPEDPRAG